MIDSRKMFYSFLLCLVFLAGCERCGQIVWTADGKRAAWYSGEPDNMAAVIDEHGKILTDLGSSLGGFAWSADGQSLYYTSREPSEVIPIEQSMLEAKPATTRPASAPSQQDDDSSGTSIGRYTNTENQLLFFLPKLKVLNLLLSPDENWLAVLAFRDRSEQAAEHFELYAYSLQTRRLYCIAGRCEMAVCFNLANRLVYVQPADNKDNPIGQLVEINLQTDPAEPPQRTHLLDLLASDTFWVQPLGEDLLLTTRKAAFPAAAQPDSVTLFLFTPKNGALVPLADRVGPIFMPSPDGKRIMFEQITKEGPDAVQQRHLAVMNANGSDPHILCRLPQHLPMYPNWHGSDRITFVAPAQVNAPTSNGRTLTDVIEYRLVDGRMEPLATLSTDWPDGLKPGYHTEDLTTTRPATTTQP